MTDPEPFDSFADDAKHLALSLTRRIFERGREWVTRQLIVLMVGAVASGALAIVVLPVFAGVSCGLVALAAVVYAIWARRLMENERRNRRWAYIQGKRIQQRELRALAAVDTATLVICGDRQARFSGRRNPELTQALAHLQGQVRRSALAAQPQPAGAAQRQPAVPAPPDLAAVRRQLQQHQAGIDALEAEIQALAVPGDSKLEQHAAERRQAERDLTDATRQEVGPERGPVGERADSCTFDEGDQLPFIHRSQLKLASATILVDCPKSATIAFAVEGRPVALSHRRRHGRDERPRSWQCRDDRFRWRDGEMHAFGEEPVRCDGRVETRVRGCTRIGGAYGFVTAFVRKRQR